MIRFLWAHYIKWLDNRLTSYKANLLSEEKDTPKYNVAFADYKRKRDRVWRLAHNYTNRYGFYYYEYLESRKS